MPSAKKPCLVRSQKERLAPAARKRELSVPVLRVLLPADGVTVFVGRAVAILAVLRADAVTVLGDFSGNPVGFWEGVDDVADELGLADAAGVTADDDDAPDSFLLRSEHSKRLSAFVLEALAIFPHWLPISLMRAARFRQARLPRVLLL